MATPIENQVYNTVRTAQQTITASAAVLTGITENGVRMLTLKAHAANAGPCYIGPSGVTTSTGFKLAAGDSITLPIELISKLYVIGTANDKLGMLALGMS